MTDAQPPKRTRRRATRRSGSTPTIQVRDEALGHATPAQTAETYASVGGELTALQQRWTRLMERAAAYAGDQMIRVVLGKHAPDAEGLCGAEKCRRAIWPCPPADSVIRKLP